MDLVEFGSVMQMQKGKKPSSQSNTSKEGYLPYVDIKAFETGDIDNYTNDEKCVSCDDGDILIVCDGSRSGLVGKAVRGYVGSTLAKISAEGMTQDYLYYFLQGKYALLNTRKKGTGTPHLNPDVLKHQRLIIPPTERQIQIVSRIEELFSNLYGGIKTLQKTQMQLDAYRQSVFAELFNRDYPKARLSDISTVIGGYAFKSKKYTPDGEYVVVKIGNVKQFRFDFSRDLTRTNEVDDSILEKYLLRQGDCLITLTGSRGKRDYGFVAMITDQKNYLLNQRVAALRFNHDMAIPRFYQYYLSSDQYRNTFFSYETGNVGQGNVGVKALKDPLVIVPNLDEQQCILEELEEKLSFCDNIDNAISLSLQQAEAMRQSILKKAFEGEL